MSKGQKQRLREIVGKGVAEADHFDVIHLFGHIGFNPINLLFDAREFSRSSLDKYRVAADVVAAPHLILISREAHR